MADRSVSVFLKANVTGYIAAIEKAKLSTKDFARDTGKAATQHKQDWSSLGKGMLITGGAIAAGIGLAVKASMDFQASMAQLKSLSGATAEEMGQLEAAAKTAGTAFGFSAKQSAEAEIELTKAGISVTDMLSGGLVGALTLAADGQMDVGEATTIAASAMTQFGLKGKDIPHIADLLAAGADKALGSVGDLGYALSSSGTVAAQFGWSLENTVGTLAEFAQNAQIGEKGGTLLRQMLLQLVSPSKQAQALMDKYGLSISDANGNMVDSSELAGRLKSSFGGLTPAVRNHALAVIFGAHAIQGANILMKDGAEVNADWVKSVNDQGFAAKQAAGKMDSLAGDVQKLKAAFQNALIDTGDQAQASLRGITKDATGVLTAYNNLSPASKKLIIDLALVVSGVTLAGGAFLVLTPRIAATVTAMKALQASSPGVVRGLTAVGKAASLVGVAMASESIAGYVGQANIATVNTNQLSNSMVKLANTGKLGSEGLKLFGSPLGGSLRNTSDALKNFGIEAYNALDQGWDARIRRIQDFGQTLPDLQKKTKQMDAAFADMVKSGHVDLAQRALNQFTDAAVKEGVPLKEVMKLFPQYTAAVLDSGKANNSATEYVKQMTKAQTDAQEAAKSLKDALDQLTNPTLDLRSAQRAYAQAVADSTVAVKKNGDTHAISTQKGRDNAAALDAQAKAAKDMADKILDSTRSEAKFRSSLDTSRDALIKTAEKMGYTSGQAKRLADKILAIPAKKSTQITPSGIQRAIRWIQTYNNALDATPSSVVTTFRQGERDSQSKTGHNARGTQNWRGGLTWVGEEGPELVDLPATSKVHSAVQSRSIERSVTTPGGGSSGMPSTMVLEVDGYQFTAYVRQQAGSVTSAAMNRAGDRIRSVPR